MFAEQPEPAPGGRRPRWIVLVCLLSILLGLVTLLGSLRPPPAGVATGVSDWHLATHPEGGAMVPGLAVHAGPGVATLAAGVTPATGPATIRGLALSPEAGTTPAGTGVASPAGTNRDP